MGKILNEYFSSLFTVEKDMKAQELGEVSGDILGTVRITVEEVLDILECMKADKSLGPRTLQEAREEIEGTLADIFASSLAKGEVPEDWKVVNVVPLFKKGCKVKPMSYRP
eukprot:g21972.t1